MRFLCALWLAACALPGQETAPAPAASPAAPATQLDSLAQQRESVRKQAQAAAAAAISAIPQAPSGGGDAFFTVAWPEPLAPPGADCDPMPKKDLDALVGNASARENVKPDLIQAVIAQESGAKPCAVSVRGAMGLMQLMPEVASRMHVDDPFDPRQSIDAGVKLLKQLLDKYKGDTSLALSAYNAGDKRVDEAGGVPDIAETQNYVNSISKKLAAAPAAAAKPVPPQ